MGLRIKHHDRGYEELLTSPEALGEVRWRAQKIMAAAGEGFDMKSTDDPHTRARAAVIAVTYEARRKNSAENTLIRSLDAGR